METELVRHASYLDQQSQDTAACASRKKTLLITVRTCCRKLPGITRRLYELHHPYNHIQHITTVKTSKSSQTSPANTAPEGRGSEVAGARYDDARLGRLQAQQKDLDLWNLLATATWIPTSKRCLQIVGVYGGS